MLGFRPLSLNKQHHFVHYKHVTLNNETTPILDG